MGALQLGSATFSSCLIGKISAHTLGIVAVIIAFICVIGFMIYRIGKSRSVSYMENQ